MNHEVLCYEYQIMTQKVIGIDGSNIRAGGGLTHLSQLIAHADPKEHGIHAVVVWGGQTLLSKLPKKSWLKKIYVPILDKSLPHRMFWQQFTLPNEVKNENCSVLFSPGGTLPRRISVPTVTMSQNMLPFEPHEAARFGLSFMRFKMFLLNLSQSRSFRSAQGLIFLTEYAKKEVIRACPGISAKVALIPHGIEPRFRIEPRKEFSKPFRLLYVSIVDVYKHQIEVARAVYELKSQGVSIIVTFVGGAYGPALTKLQSILNELDPRSEFIKYEGEVPFEDLHAFYKNSDGFIFASSCENLPNILIEAMSAGLPIACSDKGPMPEVLKNHGIYFNPEEVSSISQALRELINNPSQSLKWAQGAYRESTQYSWMRCAKETFDFISKFG